MAEAKINLVTSEQATFDVDKAMTVISEFLESPSKVWDTTKIEKKLKLQWFQFPSGLVFNGEIFGNTDMCLLYKAKSTPDDVDSSIVDPRRIELLTSGVQNRRSTI